MQSQAATATADHGPMPQGGYLLEVEDVRKEFPGVLALDGVQFRLRRGSVHALMGENGAGKSTLMKIVAGIYTPDSGTFRLNGEDIHLTSPLDALQKGIAMIHQELNLMAPMTVAENIWIRREPRSRLGFVDHGEMRRKTAELFRRLNIVIDPDAKPDEMAAVLVRRAAEIQGENCFKDAAVAKLDEKSKGARVVRIDFSPSEWKSE